MRDAKPGLLALLAPLTFLIAGCGGGALTSNISYACQPACPTGTSCTANGCVADSALDLAAATDLTSGAGCQPACGGSTPYCNDASRTCVACLQDDQCPVGQVCKQAGALTVCVQGCSDDARCGGAPKICCGNQCVDSSSDAQNCGGCGTSCSPQHAVATCASGACAPGSCDQGWADCNGDPGDGCEANVTVDPKNCGACKSSCALTNALAGCAGTCYVQACQFGYDDCDGKSENGCEVSVLADAKNCGACGNACPPVAHARTTCKNASCQLAACDAGFADCDNSPLNGCEVNTNIDIKNCGACGNKCGQDQVCVNSGCTCKQCDIPNAKTKCVNLVCTFDGCAPGWGDCNNDLKDGCEVDLTSDKANCGACGMACGQGFAACSQSVCVKCGNDCWSPEGCVTGKGKCIQFTCRAGSERGDFCNKCKGWSEISYDQWMNKGYCADVIATYRISNMSQTKCGNSPTCCGSSNACNGGDNAWHFFDGVNNYATGPSLGTPGNVNCQNWNFIDNSGYTRITACEQL